MQIYGTTEKMLTDSHKFAEIIDQSLGSTKIRKFTVLQKFLQNNGKNTNYIVEIYKNA